MSANFTLYPYAHPLCSLLSLHVTTSSDTTSTAGTIRAFFYSLASATAEVVVSTAHGSPQGCTRPSGTAVASVHHPQQSSLSSLSSDTTSTAGAVRALLCCPQALLCCLLPCRLCCCTASLPADLLPLLLRCTCLCCPGACCSTASASGTAAIRTPQLSPAQTLAFAPAPAPLAPAPALAPLCRGCGQRCASSCLSWPCEDCCA